MVSWKCTLKIKCSPDVGTYRYIGYGSTQSAAYEDAAYTKEYNFETKTWERKHVKPCGAFPQYDTNVEYVEIGSSGDPNGGVNPLPPSPPPAWYVVRGQDSGQFSSPWWGYSIQGWRGDGRYFIGDFNGDGVDDIAFLSADNRWYIVKGQDGAPFGAPWWGYSFPGGLINGRYFIGDFNGDGADDIAFLGADHRWYFVNGRDGSQLAGIWWGHSIPGWLSNGRYFIGDFTGDGADDIAFLSSDHRWYIVNGRDGSQFGSPWWGYSIPGWPSNGRYFIGDFNGDGADDIAFLSADHRWYIVNGRDGSQIGGPWWGHHIPGWPGNGTYFIGDFNGDGADDIAFLSADHRWYIVNGRDGSQIGGPWWGHHIPGWPGSGRYFVGDFNGDGADDIAFLRA